MALLKETPRGLYCEVGNFYVDPWQPVDRAIVTHAHSDHARPGCQRYLAAAAGRSLFQMRLGNQSSIEYVNYGEAIKLGGVRISLHPAGHMTGAAQVRLERAGEVAVVSGDYKLQSDPTCASFEPLRCHMFVTESTFGLPIYTWDAPHLVFEEINSWWQANQAAGSASLLLAYTIGKAQRILASIDRQIGPIVVHGAIASACRAYRECGVDLPDVQLVSEGNQDWSKCLILAPPSAQGTTWIRRFGNLRIAMASGWMRVRGIRRRRGVDRGFVISDHVDWQDLMSAIQQSRAEEIWVTHGYTEQVVKSLLQQGLNARVVKTQFRGESEDQTDSLSVENDQDSVPKNDSQPLDNSEDIRT